MIPKRKFLFEPFEGLADIYINGQKVHAGHQGRTGHIYFHLPEGKFEVTAEPHDPRVGIGLEIKEGKLVPFVPVRRTKSIPIV
jgi:hypothetical protein